MWISGLDDAKKERKKEYYAKKKSKCFFLRIVFRFFSFRFWRTEEKIDVDKRLGRRKKRKKKRIMRKKNQENKNTTEKNIKNAKRNLDPLKLKQTKNKTKRRLHQHSTLNALKIDILQIGAKQSK